MGYMHEPWARWTALGLTLPVQFWAGYPFLHQAAIRARRLTANMDTLISMGTLAAFTFSTYQVVFGSTHSDLYFDSSALIIAFLLLGRYFEARAKGRASQAIRKLLELGAKEARVVVDGEERTVPVEQVSVGDHLRIRPGEKVPAARSFSKAGRIRFAVASAALLSSGDRSWRRFQALLSESCGPRFPGAVLASL